jgi:glucose-1-phosphate thymidylyltransferase
LIPLAGKTILSIIIDQLHEAGITDFIFIVGYLGEKIQDYVKANYPNSLVISYTRMNGYGTGHAIDLAKEIVGEEEVIIVLGDTIAEYDVKAMIQSGIFHACVKRVDDPRNFGVADIDEEGFISRVVEKPAIQRSNMALVGIYKIIETHDLFICLKKLMKKAILRGRA